MAEDRRIMHEITPLMDKDVLYIADRHKKEFTYPIHNHSVFELNFVEYGNRMSVAVKISVRLPSSLISVWVRRLSSEEIRMPALPA